jgi:short-subunit dehydrogenase
MTLPAVKPINAPLVFVTGASSGLGQALAKRYGEAGFNLALVGRRSAALQDWASQLGLSADRVQTYSADVSVPDSIIRAGQDCLARQGVPNVVLACAGMSVGVDTAERADLDVMARTFATNNLGTAATFHPFVAAMQARGSGTLVGLGSVNAVRGFAGHGANCPSKAAMVSYLECLRLEMRASGVKVVTLCPGYVATPLTRQNQFSMPFLLQPDEFAERAFKAIQAQASYRVIPWQMGVVAKGLRLMPNWLFDKAFAGRARKPRLPATGS